MNEQVFHGVSPKLKKRRVIIREKRLFNAPSDIHAVIGSPISPNFNYHGGPVVKNPQVYSIFLGDWSAQEDQQRSENLNQFLTDLVKSKYMNILDQYGCSNSGDFITSVNVPTDLTTLKDNDFHVILQSAIYNNLIPEPANSSNIYIIFLDDTLGVNDANTVMCEPTSDNSFGYHYFFKTQNDNPFYYAIIPGLSDTCVQATCPGGDNMCSLKLAQTQEQRQTQVISHEFAEMITDPEINAWFDDDTKDEMGTSVMDSQELL